MSSALVVGRIFASAAALCTLVGVLPSAQAQGGPPGARVINLRTVASLPDLLYAATDTGVFRSENAGQSWVPIRNGLTNRNVSDVAGSPSLLYAGTLGGGVFRSRDDGANWAPANQGLGNLTVLALAADPSDANAVYAATSGGGIFKTTNAADEWFAVNNGLPQDAFTDIAIDPGNSQVVYATNDSIINPGFGALFKSENGGEQWTGLQAGVSAVTIAIDPTDTNVLYIGTTNGVSKSSDGGAGIDFTVLAFNQITGIAVDPEDPNIVYAATRASGVLRSEDAGLSWQFSSAGVALGELSALVIDPNDPNRLYLGGNGAGVYRTSDGAQTWRLASGGLGSADVRALAIDPRDSSDLVAGVTGGQLFQSTNTGEDWELTRSGFQASQPRSLAFDPSNSSTIYAGSSNNPNFNDGRLFKTTNAGGQWDTIATGASFFSILVDRTNTSTVYIGTDNGVFKSTDGGQNFTDANDLDNDTIGFGLTIWTILDIEQDPNNSRTLFAAGFSDSLGGGQIFRTRNAGDEWEATTDPAAFALVDALVDPGDSNRIYVGSTSGLFRSVDGGETYLPANEGLPNDAAVVVTAVVADRSDGALYLATDSGAFKSTNRGDSWFAVNSGLEEAQVRRVVADPTQGGVLYAATANAGVFHTTDGGLSWQPTGVFVGTDPIIARTSITGAADLQPGGVSPGEIVAIFGRKVGPAQGVLPDFDPVTGKLPTEVAGVAVFFGDVPAPLFFVREDQINAQVPFEVAGLDSVAVHVEVDGVSSNVARVPVVATCPGLFAAVLNQDRSLNSVENREAAGNFVILFATGHGLVNPAIMTGQPGPLAPPFPVPQQPVSVTVGGTAVTPAVALTPGLVGLLQLSVLLPPGLPPGEVDVVLQVGDMTSAPIKIFVR